MWELTVLAAGQHTVTDLSNMQDHTCSADG